MDNEEFKDPETEEKDQFDDFNRTVTIDTDEEIKAERDNPAMVNDPLTSEELELLIRKGDKKKLTETVEELDPHTVAIALSSLDPKDIALFFKLVPSDLSAEVFSLMDSDDQENLIEAFSSSEINEMVEHMYLDDLVDMVDELPANLTNKLLAAAKDEEYKKTLHQYLNFKDDTAGTIMTPEYLSFKDTDTVSKAKSEIRRRGKDMETIWEIFVTDSSRRLVGSVTLDKLLESEDDDVLSSVMIPSVSKVEVNTDQEEVAKAFRKYDVSVLPVTNAADRMVGIITYDDIIDVVYEEDEEDIQLSAKVLPSETPYMKRSIWQMVKSSALWLVILMVLNTFTSMTLSYLEAPLYFLPVLTSFLTAVMATNGNASDQTCTVIVRELALGNITLKSYWKVVWKELKASFVTALVMSLFSFGWILLELYTGMITLGDTDMSVVNTFYGGNTTALYMSVAGLIALTFFFCVMIAKWLGASLPFLAKLVHLDPAVMSQPIVSTVLDIVSICVYVLLTMLIIQGI